MVHAHRAVAWSVYTFDLASPVIYHQPVVEDEENGYFFGFRPLASTLSLKRWVETRVAGWGRWVDGYSLRWLLTVSLFSSFADLSLSMSLLVWGEDEWKPYGKDLEMALQSKEAWACSLWGFLLRRLSRRLWPLFDRLYLSNNQLTSLPDCIGQLTNLTMYGIHLTFDFNSHRSL